MRIEGMILISIDDHVVEPPTVFDRQIDARWQDRAPRIEKLASGADVWSFQVRGLPNIGLNAVVGRVPEESGLEPTAYARCSPARIDIDEQQ